MSETYGEIVERALAEADAELEQVQPHGISDTAHLCRASLSFYEAINTLLQKIERLESIIGDEQEQRPRGDISRLRI